MFLNLWKAWRLSQLSNHRVFTLRVFKKLSFSQNRKKEKKNARATLGLGYAQVLSCPHLILQVLNDLQAENLLRQVTLTTSVH